MFKKEIKKGECPKKHKRIHTKKGKIEKKDREKDEHAKTYKFVKMSNKKVKKLLKMQKCQIRVSKSHRQRQQEEKKKTTDEQMYEQKGHKEATHACKKSEKLKSFLIQKGNCCSKKKTSSRRREIKKIKGQTEKEMKKRGECETWWTKTRSDEKRTEEKLVRK